jgi:uncharacterized membrane protein
MSFYPDFPHFLTDLGVIFDQVGLVQAIRHVWVAFLHFSLNFVDSIYYVMCPEKFFERQ